MAAMSMVTRAFLGWLMAIGEREMPSRVDRREPSRGMKKPLARSRYGFLSRTKALSSRS
jgi:hypothetical protein